MRNAVKGGWLGSGAWGPFGNEVIFRVPDPWLLEVKLRGFKGLCNKYSTLLVSIVVVFTIVDLC